jgi:gliding motility-associated-like protein/uncharacterized repeat protein (TIGR01451 family)
MKSQLSIVFILLLAFNVCSQNITIPTDGNPDEFLACGEPASFKLQVSGPLNANEKILASIPEELSYDSLVVGDVVVTNGVNQITFTTINALSSTDVLTIEYKLKADCNLLDGNDEIIYSLESDPSITDKISLIDVAYPQLEITNIVKDKEQLNIGESQQISLEILAGASQPFVYASKIKLTIEHSTNVSLSYNPSTLGTFVNVSNNATTVVDEILFEADAIELAQNGNADGKLEANEFLQPILNAELLDCPTGAGETIIYTLSYGCDTLCMVGNASTSGIELNSDIPQLRMEIAKDGSGAYRKGFPGLCETAQTFLDVENEGDGTLYNLILDIGADGGFTPSTQGALLFSDFKIEGNTSVIPSDRPLVAVDQTENSDRGTVVNFTSLNSDPDGVGIGLDDLDGDGQFDDLAPGKKFTLEMTVKYDLDVREAYLAAKNISCTTGSYFGDSYTMRWASFFQDQCDNNGAPIDIELIDYDEVINNSLGSYEIWRLNNVTMKAEATESSNGSSNFQNGDSFNLDINVGANQNVDNNQCPDLHFQIELTLPDNIVPTGTDGNRFDKQGNALDDLKFISFDAATKVAVFETDPNTSTGYRLNYDYKFPLEVSCQDSSSGDGLKKIQYSYKMICSNTCDKQPVFHCGTSQGFVVNCNESTCNGVKISSLDIFRTTLGYTDETESTKVTLLQAQNSLTDTDTSNDVRLDRVTNGDMVRLRSSAEIENEDLTSVEFVFKYGKVGGKDLFSDEFDGGLKNARLIYNSTYSAGNINLPVIINNLEFTKTTGGNITYNFDIFKAITSTGRTIKAGDTFTIIANFKVPESDVLGTYINNSGTIPSAATLVPDLLVSINSTSSNGVRNCGSKTDRLETIGIFHRWNTNSSTSVKGCTVSNMNITYTNGSLGSVSGIDLFPNEFRATTVINKIYLKIPSGVEYQDGTSYFRYPKLKNDGSNSSSYQNITISDPQIIYGYEPDYNLLVWENNNAWPKIDFVSQQNHFAQVGFSFIQNCQLEDQISGNNGKLDIVLLPRTNAEINRHIDAPFDLSLADRSTAAADGIENERNIVYTPIKFTVTSSQQDITTNEDSATWKVNINNTSSGGVDMENVYIAIEIPNDNITPQLFEGTTSINLINFDTGKYWAELGSITGNRKQLEIRAANFEICGTESFKIFVGQNCAGYPTNSSLGFALGNNDLYYNCNVKEETLSVTSNNPSLKVISEISGGPFDLCTTIPVNLEVNNTANGFAYDLYTIVQIPEGATIVSDFTLNYKSQSVIIDPSLITTNTDNSIYTIDISGVTGLDISGETGLPGISNSPDNKYSIDFSIETDCNFISGSRLDYIAGGTKACGEEIEIISGQNKGFTEQILIDGITNNTAFKIEIDSDNDPIGVCDVSDTFNVKITVIDGVTSVNEKIVFSMPYYFSENTTDIIYTAGANAPIAINSIQSVAGGKIEVDFDMISGLGIGNTIEFDLEVQIDESKQEVIDLTCTTQDFVSVTTRNIANITCVSTSANCDIENITGEVTKDIFIEKNQIDINFTSANSNLNGTDEDISIRYTIDNIGNVSLSTSLILEVYFDANNNNAFDDGVDTLIKTESINVSIDTDPITNDSYEGTAEFTIASSQNGNIVLVLRESENPCLCNNTYTKIDIPDRFTCDDTLFLTHNDENTASAPGFYTIRNSSNPLIYDERNENINDVFINAIGFDPTDNYVFGVDSANRNLVIIDGNYDIFKYRTIAGLPSATPGSPYTAGEFDLAGNFYVATQKATELYVIEIDTRTSTTVVLSESVTIGDFAFNPIDGLLYFVDIDSQELKNINPTNGNVSTIGALTIPLGEVGAMYSDQRGFIYGISNEGKGFYQFDTTDASMVKISDARNSYFNDGAHCITSNMDYISNLSITKTNNQEYYYPGQEFSYLIEVKNDGPYGALNVIVNDELPIGISQMNWTSTAIRGSVSTSSGTGAINDKVILPADSSILYTVNVVVDESHTGDLTNVAKLIIPDNIIDIDLTDNEATDTDTNESEIYLTKIISDVIDEQPYINRNGDYTVVYEIIAENKGLDAGVYNIIDTFNTGEGISLESAIIGYGGENTDITGTITSPFNSGDIAVEGQLLAPGVLEKWYVIATFKVDLALLSQDSVDCPTEDASTFDPFAKGYGFMNIVKGSFTDPDPSDDWACTSFPYADIVTTKTDNKEEYIPGTQNVYTITVENLGPNASKDISVSDLVPDGILASSVNWSGSNGSSGAGNLVDEIDRLEVNENVVYTVTIDIPEDFTADIINVVAVLPSTPDPDPSCDACEDKDTLIDEIPIDLSITKTANVNEAIIGDEVEFTIVVKNNSEDVNADNILVSELLPSGYEFVSSEILVSSNNTTSNFDEFSGDWLINNLEATEEVTLKIKANILENGDHINIAEILSSSPQDIDLSNNADEAEIIANEPLIDISLSKTANVNEAIVGNEVEFTIVVKNNSEDVNADNVLVSELLPNGYEFISSEVLVSSNNTTSNFDEFSGDWLINNLEATEEVSLKIKANILENGDHTNIAEILSSSPEDADLTNNLDEAEVTPLCLTIYNEFSPNQDGDNETFIIDCIAQYPNNIVEVYDRWGKLVMRHKNYQNDWNGISEVSGTIKKGELLPVGTYFYVIDLGDGTAPFKGWLYINR